MEFTEILLISISLFIFCLFGCICCIKCKNTEYKKNLMKD